MKNELSELDSKHAIRVKIKGDDISIMDGKGIIAEGVIIDDHEKDQIKGQQS